MSTCVTRAVYYRGGICPLLLLTAASVHERGRLEWDDVTSLLCIVFTPAASISAGVAKNFHHHIETVRTGDDLSMIHLLT